MNNLKIDAANTTNILTGNLTPHEWNKIITTKSGSPDSAAIDVLAEIFYWWRPKATYDRQTGKTEYLHKFKDDAWQTSYKHFGCRLNYNHERVRTALVKLEGLGIIKRELRNIDVEGQRYNNVLFIHLCRDFLYKYSDLTPGTDNFTPIQKNKDTLSRETGVPSPEILDTLSRKTGIPSPEILDTLSRKTGIPSPEILDTYIDNIDKNKKEYRYIDRYRYEEPENFSAEPDELRYGRKEPTEAQQQTAASVSTSEFFLNESEEPDHGRKEPTKAQQQTAASVSELSVSKSFVSVSKSAPEPDASTSAPALDEPAACSEQTHLPTLPQPTSVPERLNKVIAETLHSVTAGQNSKSDNAASVGVMPPASTTSASALPPDTTTASASVASLPHDASTAAVTPSTTTTNQGSIQPQGTNQYPARKTIAEIELTEEDIERLRLMSGREFSGNFISELKTKLAVKYPQNSFANKERFLNYMAKALKNEKHDAVATSHESFKLKCNVEGKAGADYDYVTDSATAKQDTKQPTSIWSAGQKRTEEYLKNQPEPWREILRLFSAYAYHDVSGGWLAKVSFAGYDEERHVLKLAADEIIAGLVIEHHERELKKAVETVLPDIATVELGVRNIYIRERERVKL